MEDDTPSLADRMMAARLTAGLRTDKRPATREEVLRQRAIKDEATPGSEEHAMREAKLAEIEDRRPRHSLR